MPIWLLQGCMAYNVGVDGDVTGDYTSLSTLLSSFNEQDIQKLSLPYASLKYTCPLISHPHYNLLIIIT